MKVCAKTLSVNTFQLGRPFSFLSLFTFISPLESFPREEKIAPIESGSSSSMYGHIKAGTT